MSICIAGAGWITPLGGDMAEVWQRLCRGEEAKAESICDPVGKKPYPVYRVPENALTNLPRHARLRRASAISRFAAAAGLAALDQARSTSHKIDMQRVALVFAVANGGVIYTKRFYHDIVATGAQSASPLLFPETVFNAPASHLAALLGIEGASYTLVGDGAVGLVAIKMAEDLLASDDIDFCLVVAAEEADWLLCDAYHKWRLLRATPPIEPFADPPRGTILSEGAGAILLARNGAVRIEAAHPGRYFSSRKDAAGLLAEVARDLEIHDASIVIGSANGTFIDAVERNAVGAAEIYSPKPALGESVGASALWQTIVAAQFLTTKELPPLLHAPPRKRTKVSAERVVVLSCGLNQQVAGVRLSI
jgi:3-oxoacyl-(acyl-carrier-protein) synthase